MSPFWNLILLFMQAVYEIWDRIRFAVHPFLLASYIINLELISFDLLILSEILWILTF